MIAATIAVGREWQAMAELAAESVRRYLGLDPVIITQIDTPKPSQYKLRLLDLFAGETVFYFDADARCLAPWDVQQFDGTPWPVVVQDWHSHARDTDCRTFSIDGHRYFAAGFWIAGPRQRDIWRNALEIATEANYRTAFKYEQSALNTACQRADSPLVFLDKRHWWITTLNHRAPADVKTIALGGALDGPDRRAYDEALRRAK